MSRFDEMPASPKRGEKVALHWSKKRRATGLMITRQGESFGVWNIAPVMGHPTAFMFDLVDTEDDARNIANREWVGMAM
ncbi:hypothetical protein ACF09H_22330 [Streptomyces sp. NPDC014983]|uniref:hypothetical protein n=1 Tax=Streptomyces sp. NPDC014983 TaxID=3364933 RepID=UPI003702EAB8